MRSIRKQLRTAVLQYSHIVKRLSQSLAATLIVERLSQSLAATLIVERLSQSLAATLIVERLSQSLAATLIVERLSQSLAATQTAGDSSSTMGTAVLQWGQQFYNEDSSSTLH